MASINQLKIEKTYQIKVVGKPNTWCKIVGKTDKRVYVYLYEGNAFVKGENGEPKTFMKDPKNILVNKMRKTSTGKRKAKKETIHVIIII